MKEADVKEKNIKIPLYVNIYETISGWLKEGKYKPGEKLPGENILAEQLAVSRGTLRQAMLLLQEDGLIMNHQGKGNIVLSNQDIDKPGLEKINNPIVEFCNTPIDKIVTEIGFQPPTAKHQQVLKLRSSSLLAVLDLTFYSDRVPVGYIRGYMPYEVLAESDVNLEDPDTVYEFYLNLLNMNGLYSDSRMRMAYARERIAEILEVPEEIGILTMEEIVYSEFDIPILSQKLYFSPDQHELCVRRRNK